MIKATIVYLIGCVLAIIFAWVIAPMYGTSFILWVVIPSVIHASGFLLGLVIVTKV